MKTHEQIKKGLECCSKSFSSFACMKVCPYIKEPSCGVNLYRDALALIQQLQDGIDQWELVAASPGAVEDMARENSELLEKVEQLQDHLREARKKIKQLQAERDAAVKDCGCFPCQTCEERENGDLCRMCEIEGGYRSFHQWRGVQKEERG